MNQAPVSPARNIIITAKNDKRVEFYDGTSHKQLAALNLSASVLNWHFHRTAEKPTALYLAAAFSARTRILITAWLSLIWPQGVSTVSSTWEPIGTSRDVQR